MMVPLMSPKNDILWMKKRFEKNVILIAPIHCYMQYFCFLGVLFLALLIFKSIAVSEFTPVCRERKGFNTTHQKNTLHRKQSLRQDTVLSLSWKIHLNGLGLRLFSPMAITLQFYWIIWAVRNFVMQMFHEIEEWQKTESLNAKITYSVSDMVRIC